jgi:hypothetical protein
VATVTSRAAAMQEAVPLVLLLKLVTESAEATLSRDVRTLHFIGPACSWCRPLIIFTIHAADGMDGLFLNLFVG